MIGQLVIQYPCAICQSITNIDDDSYILGPYYKEGTTKHPRSCLIYLLTLYVSPDPHQYSIRRQQCLYNDMKRKYTQDFSYFTGPREYYPDKEVAGRASYVPSLSNQLPPPVLDISKEEKLIQKQAMLQIAGEFGRGVKQQKVRDRTKELPGSLPYVMRNLPREVNPLEGSAVDRLLTPDTAAPVQRATNVQYRVKYRAQEIIALITRPSEPEPFYLAIVKTDIRITPGGEFMKKTMDIQFLDIENETDEYTIYVPWGELNSRNSPEVIKDRVHVEQEDNEYKLPLDEKERLLRLFNGDDDSDAEPEDEEEDEEEEEEESQEERPPMVAYTSRSGRAATRIDLSKGSRRR